MDYYGPIRWIGTLKTKYCQEWGNCRLWMPLAIRNRWFSLHKVTFFGRCHVNRESILKQPALGDSPFIPMCIHCWGISSSPHLRQVQDGRPTISFQHLGWGQAHRHFPAPHGAVLETKKWGTTKPVAILFTVRCLHIIDDKAKWLVGARISWGSIFILPTTRAALLLSI